MPETLVPALDELERGWRGVRPIRPSSRSSNGSSARTSAGRARSPSPTGSFPGKRLYLKREDLNHTGAHKINNALGQALLALRLGKRRIVAETGAGQHGVATATVCARFGFDCVVYMGAEDMRRQRPNVERMHLLGAEVRAVEFGTRTLKEALSEAIRDWITNVETTHYLIGTCAGPAPYPELVSRPPGGDRTRGAGPDARVDRPPARRRRRLRRRRLERDRHVRRLPRRCRRSADRSRGGRGRRLATAGRTGVLHGARSSTLADDDGQILDAHSISAGLDYPGVGPEHAWLRDTGRVEYVPTPTSEALAAFHLLSEREGIIPALEPAHALARAVELDEEVVLVNMCGRGDKDLADGPRGREARWVAGRRCPST